MLIDCDWANDEVGRPQWANSAGKPIVGICGAVMPEENAEWPTDDGPGVHPANQGGAEEGLIPPPTIPKMPLRCNEWVAKMTDDTGDWFQPETLFGVCVNKVRVYDRSEALQRRIPAQVRGISCPTLALLLFARSFAVRHLTIPLARPALARDMYGRPLRVHSLRSNPWQHPTTRIEC
jgi:hypothetical protein